MRLSCRSNDPGYDLVACQNRHLHVFLDGRDICVICHTADEERSEAHVYKLDVEGKKYIDPETDDAAQEVLHGKVEIRATNSIEHQDLA